MDSPQPTSPQPDELPFSEEHIQAHSVDGRYRRAPKISMFITIGVVVGLVLGTILGFILTPEGSDKRGVAIIVAIVAMTTVTTLIAAWIATYLDARSVKRAQNDPAPDGPARV
ncbi:ABC transporter permease family protein [Jonesia denitrificans]|uniref:Uncharacterized protein n=1 Tax=Jonesia denitrificans (strain ATCC 14870 / DSM 20603 / BCRC 15368 / CIP 55.134 / JCM 11481 / NBRC 15587 / NCTC 10816 / Prevot 55134) TaxID=471856 RepID=C7R2J6_JONDD|nr:hypothetical protein [Jonesia denitrificans]ACV09987.1 hypothetical protein Jden_2353 [Jonesia denitrificans DSM 20603]ASE08775.1 hypothetical protein CEP80_06255 [Jonesia denitrificans]QXB43381.1 hypothetical protein I6L70_00225 [Jonesia denitrificans]SQH22762.1 Uncharacterised protein [Jonesia denitrificans]